MMDNKPLSFEWNPKETGSVSLPIERIPYHSSETLTLTHCLVQVHQLNFYRSAEIVARLLRDHSQDTTH